MEAMLVACHPVNGRRWRLSGLPFRALEERSHGNRDALKNVVNDPFGVFDALRACALSTAEHDTVREHGRSECFDVFGQAIGSVPRQSEGLCRFAQCERATRADAEA